MLNGVSRYDEKTHGGDLQTPPYRTSTIKEVYTFWPFAKFTINLHINIRNMNDQTHIGQYKGDEKYGGGWVSQGNLKIHYWIRTIFPNWEYRIIERPNIN